MPLAFLVKEIDDVNVQLRWLRQAHTIRGRGTWRRLSDMQCRSITNGHDLSDGRVAVEHRYRLAPADGPQVLAQTGFEIGNSHVPHDYIMTMNGHEHKWSTNLRSQWATARSYHSPIP
jgi:hypothetical protein